MSGTGTKDSRFVKPAQKVFFVFFAILLTVGFSLMIVSIGWWCHRNDAIFSKTAAVIGTAAIRREPGDPNAPFFQLKKGQPFSVPVAVEKINRLQVWASKPFMLLSGHSDKKTIKEFWMPEGDSVIVLKDSPGPLMLKGIDDSEIRIVWIERR